MFGFSLTDSFGNKFYQELTFEELENLVAGMKALARSQPPVDFEKLSKEARDNPKIQAEEVGPMVRVKGSPLPEIAQYNKFVRLGFHALQLCYYEMIVDPLGRVGQVTVVDNYKMPLEDELKYGFIDMFLDWSRKEDIKMMKTPGHVLVAIQTVKYEESKTVN